jgi:hypothetical protein
MIDLRNPPVDIQRLPEPLRSLAVQTANQLLDAGVGFSEAVRRAVESAREEETERIKDTQEIAGGRARGTNGG